MHLLSYLSIRCRSWQQHEFGRIWLQMPNLDMDRYLAADARGGGGQLIRNDRMMQNLGGWSMDRGDFLMYITIPAITQAGTRV